MKYRWQTLGLHLGAALLLSVVVGATRSAALETDILFGDPVKPNILILFDNSGSMNDAATYNSVSTYTGSYNPTTIYSRCRTYYSNCTCRRTNTYWSVSDGTCGWVDDDADGVDDRTSYKKLGNRLNYEANSPNKMSVAKSVIRNLLQRPDVQNVRWGLMVYTNQYLPNNYSSTSDVSKWHNDTTVLRAPIADNNQQNVTNIINGLGANGGTPSGNRLVQAGNYFAGSLPGFPSPIQYTCQRNYIIVITDGRPEVEGNTINAYNKGDFTMIESWLTSKLGSNIDADGDGDENPPGTGYNGGSKYFDDVAWVLQRQDLLPSMDGTQNITTFTIGFDVDNYILANAAVNGGGKYFIASTADQLADALRRTINLIMTDAQSFVAPVVPVNALKRTQSGDRLYIALFQPLQSSNFWAGNIKKYGIATNGDLLSPSGSAATNPDGSLKPTSSSYYDSVPSGGAVTKGGVGERLLTRSSARNIYTYLGNTSLTASTNAFTTGNTGITKALLNVPDDTTRNQVISYVRGEDVFDDDEDGNTTEKRDWILGDFIHSTPLVATYDDGTSVIFDGSNDGQLHAFDDASGDELWAFVPPAILPRLKELLPADAPAHPFLVDGSPKLLKTDSGQRIVVFGLRRGGSSYYALDVTNKTSPRYLWSISSSTSGFSELGQAWSEPALGKMGTASSFQYVALFGAGYDTYYDDPTLTNPDTVTPVGRGVFAVNALTGALINALRPSGMNYAVASNLSAIDVNSDDTIDLAYFGDLGGNLWRWDLPTTLTKLFTAPTGHKIFAAPDIVIDHAFLDVFFGTGDLASPLYEGVTDRLYSFRDDGFTGGYTEAALVDVTDNLIQEGSSSQKETLQNQLDASHGWYIRLPHSGEKSLSSPLAFFDVLFTTFVPTREVCSGGGDAYLYTLGYDAGAAVVDANDNGTLTKDDRSKDIGNSIPTEVTATIREDGAVGYVGVGGAIPRVDLSAPPLNLVPIYWRELY